MAQSIRKLTFSALFAAVICLATAVFPIPLPFGYVNMGDAFVLLGAIVLGPVHGALSAGIGAALADLFLGYGVYVPATFVIKAVMALVLCALLRVLRNASVPRAVKVLLGAVCAECVMVLGYFAYECILYGVSGALASIPGNLIQAGFAVLAFCILDRINAKKHFSNGY